MATLVFSILQNEKGAKFYVISPLINSPAHSSRRKFSTFFPHPQIRLPCNHIDPTQPQTTKVTATATDFMAVMREFCRIFASIIAVSSSIVLR